MELSPSKKMMDTIDVVGSGGTLTNVSTGTVVDESVWVFDAAFLLLFLPSFLFLLLL